MTPTYMAVANMLISFAIAFVYLREWKKHRSQPWAWIYISFALLGIYWAGLYFIVLFHPVPLDSITFGRNFVRPAFLVTLSVILAAALVGRERR